MDLKNYIEQGILRKGSVKALHIELGIAETSIADAKAHRRGIPNDAAVKLAMLIEADPIDVIRASELATERKPEKRAFWENFVNPAKTARVAGIAVFVMFAANFATPSPAEAAPALNHAASMICIM